MWWNVAEARAAESCAFATAAELLSETLITALIRTLTWLERLEGHLLACSVQVIIANVMQKCVANLYRVFWLLKLRAQIKPSENE